MSASLIIAHMTQKQFFKYCVSEFNGMQTMMTKTIEQIDNVHALGGGSNKIESDISELQGHFAELSTRSEIWFLSILFFQEGASNKSLPS